MSEYFFQDKTSEKAIEKAEKELGLNKESLHIEVLEEKDKSLLGMKWGKICSIKVTIKPQSTGEASLEERVTKVENTAGIAEESLKKLLKLTDIQGDIELSETNDEIILNTNVNDDVEALFIGRRGKNLDAFQYIVNKIVEKKVNCKTKRVIIDCENYRARRIGRIEGMAHKAIMTVKESGEYYTFAPMKADERRIIHMTAKKEGFPTESQGEGIEKKVVIFPPNHI
ncbi:MAG: Jag N-terminal domain-containing protein [Proteobacteria bacterium]|nr:Jag N-terminal domain-containing protein [Pseudomonadota bacterium]